MSFYSDVLLSHSWGFNSIAPFMCLPSLVNMREVCKDGFTLVEKQKKQGIITKRIRAELGKFLPDVDGFITALNGGVVSGGFLLSMCDPSIKYDDIDIYVNAINAPFSYGIPTAANTTSIDKHLYWLLRLEDGDEKEQKVYPDKQCEYQTGMSDADIRNVKTTTIKQAKFQIIEIARGVDVKDVIRFTFDFSVLVNTWDGKHLEITDTHGITNRVITFNQPIYDLKSRHDYRVAKYEQKGFDVLPSNRRYYTHSPNARPYSDSYYTFKLMAMRDPEKHTTERYRRFLKQSAGMLRAMLYGDYNSDEPVFAPGMFGIASNVPGCFDGAVSQSNFD